VERDFRKFVKVPKGQIFKPKKIKDRNEAIEPYKIFFKAKIEVLDEFDDIDKEFKIIEEEFEARYRTHQDNKVFVDNFRKLLASCSDETLIELMRCGEVHALRHNIDCDDCENSDDEIEISHHTRSLGHIWLEAIQKLR
jgi:sugar-specific transcriptional regulator TrmB